ncbi:MAG: hypothetical protein IKA32_01245 [Lentisphaeria bacterium]|nr:hypothetical protein [Lentisphaeria bacterium]
MDKFTSEELRRLASAEFNLLLQNDQVLKDLENSKYDKRAHSCALLEALCLGEFRIGKLPVLPLTAAKWAFLWMLGNGFVSDSSDKSDLSDTDIDVMLYILSIPDLADIDCNLHEVPVKASGYRFAPQLPRDELVKEIYDMISRAFLPLAMLPAKKTDNEDAYFDEIWLTAVAGCAARESGESLYYCMHKMSLSTVFALWVNYRRREGTEKISYPVPSEIEKKIADRVDQLGREFLTRP